MKQLIQNKKLILLLGTLVFVDQITKYLIRSRGGFYICNSGVAFGIKINPILFWIIAGFVILFIVYYTAKIKKQDTITKKIKNLPAGRQGSKFNLKFKIENLKFEANMGVILILSGAVANMIDRWQFGCVIDFIDLRFWPVFNLADAFITIGVALLLAKYLKKCYNNSEKER